MSTMMYIALRSRVSRRITPRAVTLCARGLSGVAANDTAEQLNNATAAASARAAAAANSFASFHEEKQEQGPMFEDPRLAILNAALKHVPREGWSMEALAAGAQEVGFPSVAAGMFDAGAVELVWHVMRQANEAMSKALEGMELDKMSGNERIAAGVKARLQYLEPYSRSWPQAMALGAAPSAIKDTSMLLAVMADECWFHAGDRSTDLNWYTRRMLLMGVYAVTETYWLTDSSPGKADTWQFLDRRLADVTLFGRQVGEGLAVASAAAGGVASLATAAVDMLRPLLMRESAAAAAAWSAHRAGAARGEGSDSSSSDSSSGSGGSSGGSSAGSSGVRSAASAASAAATAAASAAASAAGAAASSAAATSALASAQSLAQAVMSAAGVAAAAASRAGIPMPDPATVLNLAGQLLPSQREGDGSGSGTGSEARSRRQRTWTPTSTAAYGGGKGGSGEGAPPKMR